MAHENPDDVLGVVPAAGRATRLGSLRVSKEVLPVWRPPELLPRLPPLPACRCLLDAFETAGIGRALLLIRPGKEDIPRALGPATDGGTRLEYVVVDDPPAPPFTVDAVYERLADRTVALGFPDILFEPREAFVSLLGRLGRTKADAVLGLFPHPSSQHADLVTVETHGFVRSIRRSVRGVGRGALTWGLAVWQPRLTDFLHERVRELDAGDSHVSGIGLGDILDLAVRSGLTVHGMLVADAPFLDIGTPAALAEALRRSAPPTD